MTLPASGPQGENINELLGNANNSIKQVSLEISALQGRKVTVNGLDAIVPQWAMNHHQITQKLEKAVKQMQLSGANTPQFTVAKDILQKCQTIERQIFNQATLQSLDALSQEKAQYVDQAKLLAAIGTARTDPISEQSKEWHLHLGLLMNAFFESGSPDMQKKIMFMALNYLAKAAPISTEPDDASLKFQRGILEDSPYHRGDSSFSDKFFKKEILKSIAAPPNDYWIIDTREIEYLLPIQFDMMPNSSREINDSNLTTLWSYKLENTLSEHFKEGIDWQKPLDKPVIFDLTEFIEKEAKNVNPQGLDDYQKQVSLLEKKVDAAIKLTVEKFTIKGRTLPPDDRIKLEVFLRAQIEGIYRTEIKGVGVIATIGLFKDPAYYKGTDQNVLLKPTGPMNELEYIEKLMLKKKSDTSQKFASFVRATGVQLGRIKGREVLPEFYTLPEILQKEAKAQLLEYAVKGPNTVYYKNKKAIVDNRTFQACWNSFQRLPPERSEIKVLGISTMQLVGGLLDKISQEQWDRLNQNEDTRLLFQTSLYNIIRHLATADIHKNDFARFTQEIEMVHYEIADLLTLISPYSDADLNRIVIQRMSASVPTELQRFMSVGLAKSGMNAFAGINAAVFANNPKPVRTTGELVYYELAGMVGHSGELENVLSSKDIPAVDLYVGEFNHNATVKQDHRHYKRGDIIRDVTRLLQQKPQSQRLTVAVDCTIDYLSSDRTKELLKHFSNEIQSGKLNFVFFRSGQKFDMLGMDNYYGAPVMIVNNGDKAWDPFKILSSHYPAIETDRLTKQWFCLNNEAAPEATDQYRKAIFENTRKILDLVPPALKLNGNPNVVVCDMDPDVLSSFIDIKFTGTKPFKDYDVVEQLLKDTFAKHHVKYHGRSSFGFYHPNFNFIEPSTLRINPGINPQEIKVFQEFMQAVAQKFGGSQTSV